MNISLKELQELMPGNWEYKSTHDSYILRFDDWASRLEAYMRSDLIVHQISFIAKGNSWENDKYSISLEEACKIYKVEIALKNFK